MDDWKKAGILAAKALEYGRALIVKASSLLEVTEKIEEKILAWDAQLAFPVQISMDDVAAHYCAASGEKTLFSSQLAKLDLGVSVNGCIADNALTVDLSGANKELVEASRRALQAAINTAKPGARVSEVGRAINQAMQELGFNPIRNLTGHGLGKFDIHALPTIPNYDNGDLTVLREGQIIAIEPFATPGIGIVQETATAEVFQLIARKPVRNPITRELLEEILSYNGLPFARRWLERKFSAQKVNYSFNELKKMGILREYRPLAEKTRALVSQAEHTIIVKEKPEILTLE